MKSEINTTVGGQTPHLATVLDRLGSYVNQFGHLKALCDEYINIPTFIFERKYLDWLIHELEGSSGVYEESESFLYLIHTLEIFEFGLKANNLTEYFLQAIERTRATGVKNELREDNRGRGRKLGPITASPTHQKETNYSDLAATFNDNRVALGVFIFSLVYFLHRVPEVPATKEPRQGAVAQPQQQPLRRFRGQ